MNEIQRKEKVDAAIKNIASLIAGSNQQLYSSLLTNFKQNVKVVFGGENENIHYAAGCKSMSTFDFSSNNEMFNNNISIVVNLPLPPQESTPEYNCWIVDIHHELFHAFTKILNSGKACEIINNSSFFAGTGGKLTKFTISNGNRLSEDIPLFRLFNELTTDLMAYILTYRRFLIAGDVSIDKILHNNQLEEIVEAYGYKNGYYELLQLGLLLFDTFTNYPVNYDFVENNGKMFFDIKTENMQYNDLLYGIMYNPIFLKNKLLEFISMDDWNNLNESSKKVLSSFENNGRLVEENEIGIIMNIMKKYFERKIQLMRDNDIDEERIKLIENNFEKRYSYVSKKYNISDKSHEDNFRRI